jgi:hypothetical protein
MKKEYTTKQLKPYYDALGPLKACNFAVGADDERWRQLSIALVESSQSVAHAEEIIYRFMRTERYGRDGELITGLPEPVELRAFARSVADQATPKAPPPCADCEDLPGWQLVEIKGAPMRDYCHCPRGQWQKAVMRRDHAPKEPRSARMAPGGDWAQRAAGERE